MQCRLASRNNCLGEACAECVINGVLVKKSCETLTASLRILTSMLVPICAWPTAPHMLHARIAHERARTRRYSPDTPQLKTPHSPKPTPWSSRAQHPNSHARQLATNRLTRAPS
eukprot:4704458-Prymnesium_polylepis.1